MEKVYETTLKNNKISILSDFNNTEVVIDSKYGKIIIELEQNWCDFLEDELTEDNFNENKDDSIEMVLSVLKDTVTEGEVFSHFADAHLDDNSIRVMRKKTQKEIDDAKENPIYSDIVTSIGEELADKICAEWGQK